MQEKKHVKWMLIAFIVFSLALLVVVAGVVFSNFSADFWRRVEEVNSVYLASDMIRHHIVENKTVPSNWENMQDDYGRSRDAYGYTYKTFDDLKENVYVNFSALEKISKGGNEDQYEYLVKSNRISADEVANKETARIILTINKYCDSQ